MAGPPITASSTHIHDLPDAILTNIFATISDTRSRNAAALVCRKWLLIERTTRTALALRGNERDLFMIPTCFRSVTHLDLSLLSPWGHSLLSSSSDDPHPHLLAHLLRQAFPGVTSLTLYSRTPSTLQVLAPYWPNLKRVKLVRWHQRSPSPLGSDFSSLFEHCLSLSSLDLSDFYYWTEDLPAALSAHPFVAAGFTRLDLMTRSFAEGFKTNELRAISAACPNLVELRAACLFDPRYLGFVGDEALQAIASSCPKLSILHLADASSLLNTRGNPNEDGSAAGDAEISRSALIGLFTGLPLLEELALDVCKNVRDSGLALEVLCSKCPRLRSLKLGQFQGLCMAIGSQLDGIALCSGLRSLFIKNSADLTDMGLIAISRGSPMLTKFEVQGCKNITVKGLRTMACLLRGTLVDVKISCCKNLNAMLSLRAVEPIRDRIQRLHIDCIWDGSEQRGNLQDAVQNFDLIEMAEEAGSSRQPAEYMNLFEADGYGVMNKKKKFKNAAQPDSSYMKSNGNTFWCKTWDQLQYLSLWVAVGELLTPLAAVGLEDCPQLEEIRIKVEGDCREQARPSENQFGLSTLRRYPRLRKMQLDCGDVIGNALTAPSGQMDLSLWERFFLNGIGYLRLNELDYWLPQDRDLNQRGLTLPAAGLLAQCGTLRKLFIHGTANEHFMNFLLKIPNLRDVQLREDYYPAPENDMSTEMRVDSCSRFEDALNGRRILD
ncbi:F-box/LRR-repeat MAX2 homolog A [Malania oleifera]|uniref:F-box/LRR-repeat MAX2 homolog A n=1 Tax=Malania oleifera TaxID=397392 RepID=UPI0025AE172E|nr:F-box/LRR-repeat MAX2 homolog A [Malania oleifera]